MRKLKVLFLISDITSENSYRKFLDTWTNNKKFSLYVISKYPVNFKNIEKCLYFFPNNKDKYDSKCLQNGIFFKLSSLIYRVKTNFFKIFSLINEFSKVEKFFSQYKFDFLITPGDRKEGLQISTCNIANKKKVPIIIFPTARYADSEVLKKSRNGYLINQKIIKLILFFFKEQVFIDQNQLKFTFIIVFTIHLYCFY